MSIQDHILVLQNKHALLKQQVADEATRPAPDFALITQMKKQKLALKEEIQSLMDESVGDYASA